MGRIEKQKRKLMEESNKKMLIEDENELKVDSIPFSFNQGEIELLVDALEEYMENAPDEWFDTPSAQRVLSNLKSKSNFYLK